MLILPALLIFLRLGGEFGAAALDDRLHALRGGGFLQHVRHAEHADDRGWRWRGFRQGRQLRDCRQLRLGLRGGGIGGGGAILMFILLGTLSSWWRATPGGDQIEAMFGSFGLELKGYVLIGLIAAGIAVTTGFVSRVIVFRHLRRLL